MLLLLLSGCLFPRTWHVQHPLHEVPSAMPLVEGPVNHVVFVVGDGMGLAQVSAARIANGGRLHLDRMPVVGLVETRSATDVVTDSAASATAYSTGVATHNAAIGVDVDDQPVETWMEWAAAREMRTGVVATSRITHATPAAFGAHQPTRYDHEAIAVDLAASPIEVFVGGGYDRFADRSDDQDLVAVLEARGVPVVRSLEAAPPEGPVAALLEDGPMPRSDRAGPGVLEPLARFAAQRMHEAERSALLVEGSQIDWAGHYNHFPWMVEEVLELDRTVGMLLALAEERGDMLVVVTADHETGGLAIKNGEPGEWVKSRWATHHHTPVPVPIYAYGPGAEAFAGTYANIEVATKLRAAFRR